MFHTNKSYKLNLVLINMATYDIGGGGILFTDKSIICDTKGMSNETLEYLIKEHDEWNAERNAKKVERREKFTGYVNQAVDYVKSYFQ